eukprot:scaffold7296_cov100-Isochrysis_galbana.AAC.3
MARSTQFSSCVSVPSRTQTIPFSMAMARSASSASGHFMMVSSRLHTRDDAAGNRGACGCQLHCGSASHNGTSERRWRARHRVAVEQDVRGCSSNRCRKTDPTVCAIEHGGTRRRPGERGKTRRRRRGRAEDRGGVRGGVPEILPAARRPRAELRRCSRRRWARTG